MPDDEPPSAPTPLGDFFRGQADRHRQLAAARPDDHRHVDAARALDDVGAAADRQVAAGEFYATHLLRHHFDGGRFAWPDGRAARAVAAFGFDTPADDADDYEAFLGEICSLVSWDAASHISLHEAELDRRDAPALARRYGIGVDRVHSALDKMRHPHLFQVGIPHWHELTPAMRDALDRLDGTWVDRVRRRRPAGDRPTLVNNVGADTEAAARQTVGAIVGLDPDVLGVRLHPRIYPPRDPDD